MKNLLLTLLALLMLAGIALAVPSGDISAELVEDAAEETEDGGEFDFL